MAGAAGIAALGVAAASAAMDLSRLSAQATDVEASFKTMAGGGQASQDMLEELTAASRGAINDFDLMLTANRAMLLGVSKNTDDMVALMDVARARSQAMGLTTVQAFGDIVTGIGRMSPMILDNLGIVVDAAAANQEYAQSVGKAVGQLSEQEKKQALVNAVIRDSADLVRANEAAGDDAASKFERMDAAIQNAKIALGDLFSPAVAVVAQAIADAAQAAADGLEANRTAAAAATSDVGMLTDALRRQNEALRFMEATGDTAGESYRSLADANAQTKREIALASIAAMDADTAMRMAAGGTDVLRGEFIQLGAAAQSTGPMVRQMGLDALAAAEQFEMAANRTRAGSAALQGIAAGMVDNLGGQGTLRWLQDQEATLRIQQQQWRDVAGYSAEYIDNVLTPAYLSALREGASELDKSVSSAGRLATTVPQISDEFRNLQSAISQALSGALDPGVGVDPNKILESFGFSEDRINENARRLADIAANGLKGQDWLGEFAAEAPNVWKAIRSAVNPQEEAAFLLRDFQDGLRPELIDRGRAKELVKRILTGDANMAELAQEIATELAGEMGVSMQTALGAAQGALGVAGTGGLAGSDAATAFADSATATMGERGGGSEMVDSFIAQARSVYGRLRTAGQDAGKEFGSGFLVGVSDVPASFVALITSLVLPGVQSGIRTQTSLEGAATP